jgi:hypothetical protein
VAVYLIDARAKGVSMDTHCERVLQQIAFGYVLTASGGMRKMYNHELICLAREACDQLGIDYSDGACTQPFETRSGAVPVANQIRTYLWCSPPRTGRQRIRPALATVRDRGESLSKARCVDWST